MRGVTVFLLLDEEEIDELKRRAAQQGDGPNWRRYASAVATDAIAALLPQASQRQRAEKGLATITEALR